MKMVAAPPELSKSSLGFWIYLMTDCVLFASLFATFAVLRGNTFGGPAESELFDLPFVLIETLILLTSSFVCGVALVMARHQYKNASLVLFGVTLALGLAFLGMELHEFSQLVHEGNSWQRSGSLSAFFTLVGTHGAHILVGLLWLTVMMSRVIMTEWNEANLRRMALFSMFWHFLDIIWIFIFTIVYLLGVLR